MTTTSRIAIALLAAGWLSAPMQAAATAPAGCGTAYSEGDQLPASFADNGYLYLRVSLNGAPERWFVLDTGTTPSVVDLNYARAARLDLTGRGGRGHGAGPDRPSYVRTNADVRVGSLRRPHVAFEALSFAPPGPDGQPIGGVLGTSFLKDRVLVADYRLHRAWIGTHSDGCAAGQPFRLRYNIVVTTIRVGGRAMDAIIDSGGAYELLVQPSAAPKLGLSDVMAKGKSGAGWGYGGKVEVRGGTGPAIQVGSVQRGQSEVAFIPIPLNIDVAIGTLFLRHTRMTVDYVSKRIAFEE